MNASREPPHATYIEEEAPSYKALLEFLNLSFVNRENIYENFIYRGVGNSDYELLPSAFREDGEDRLYRLLGAQPTNFINRTENPMDTKYVHIAAEAFALSLFYRFANSQALPLPPVSQNLHVALLTAPLNVAPLGILMQGSTKKWPPPELWPLLALAQHYGVPTRMLDWTSDPYTAAYFACKSALQSKKKGTHIAIWMASKGPMQLTHQFRGTIDGTKIPYHIDIVEAPYAGNPNLAAQRGVFTLVHNGLMDAKEEESKLVDRRTIDQSFNLTHSASMNTERGRAFFGKFKTASNAVIKTTLKYSEVPKLMKYLHYSGWHGSRLFPGYQGCEIAIGELELMGNSQKTLVLE